MVLISYYRKEITQQLSIEKSENFIKTWIVENLRYLKIPICSPTVYKPMVISIVLLGLQSCAGDAYITKFIIQILNSEENRDETMRAPTLQASIASNNKTETFLNEPEPCHKEDSNGYSLPLVIQSVKLIVIIMMTFLLPKVRVRFLYFLSLILTVILLIFLGLICDNSFSSAFFSPSTIRYIKTILLCLHVIFIQFGLQTLPGLLMDVLYPTSCKAILKGLSISIGSVFLIVLIFILKSFSYSHAFWIMAGIILIAAPFLYMFLPEIRNIGTDMSEDFFLPFQTVFNFVLPENNKDSLEVKINAKNHWKTAVKNKVRREISIDYCARRNPKVHFDKRIPAIEDTLGNTKWKTLNGQRVAFVSNILGQTGYLCQNHNETRVLIGRGRLTFRKSVIKKGSIFLFSDVLIIAKCVIAGRRYVGEICFKLDSPTFGYKKNGAEMIFSGSDNVETVVELEDECMALIWETYIQFARSSQVFLPTERYISVLSLVL